MTNGETVCFSSRDSFTLNLTHSKLLSLLPTFPLLLFSFFDPIVLIQSCHSRISSHSDRLSRVVSFTCLKDYSGLFQREFSHLS